MLGKRVEVMFEVGAGTQWFGGIVEEVRCKYMDKDRHHLIKFFDGEEHLMQLDDFEKQGKLRWPSSPSVKNEAPSTDEETLRDDEPPRQKVAAKRKANKPTPVSQKKKPKLEEDTALPPELKQNGGVDGILRYMDLMEPGEDYLIKQEDTRGGKHALAMVVEAVTS